jgi:hypothetical protein
MVCSVCTTAYILDCYPNAAGEVMAYMNFARVMVGRPRFVRWGADFRVGFRLGIISRSGVRSRDLMCRLGFKRWLWRLRLRSWCCFNFSGRKCAIKRVQSNSVGSVTTTVHGDSISVNFCKAMRLAYFIQTNTFSYPFFRQQVLELFKSNLTLSHKAIPFYTKLIHLQIPYSPNSNTE